MRQENVGAIGALGTAIVIFALAACSGSSTVSPPAAQSAGTGASATVVTSTTGSTTVSATSANGTSVSVQLPAASANAAVTESLTSTAPSGYAASRALRGGLFAERSALAGIPGAVLYIVLTSNEPVTLEGAPSVTVVLPTTTAGDSYYLAGLSSSGTTIFTEGPASISGTTLLFGSLLAAPGISITPTDPLVIELYVGGQSVVSSPTPTPSSTPVPLVAVPTSLTFATTTSAAQTFTVTQSGIATAGAFSVATAPAGIVTVSAGQAPGAYVVTPVAVGTATITITGTGGASTTVTATVQAVPITVSSTNRGH